MAQSEWKTFFDAYADRYMQECFTQNTMAEADFLFEELGLPQGSRVLDVGCGTGRHAVELARRGYRVTGVDLSDGMLHEAERAAREAGVEVEWVRGDATRMHFDGAFDAAICLCEGAFGLIGSGDDPHTHDLAILARIGEALKPGAELILTALNGMRKIRAATPESIAGGEIDPQALSEKCSVTYEVAGRPVTFTGVERGFVPSELRLMLTVSGFDVAAIYGGTAGNWGRRAPDLDEMELMAIATRRLTG